MIDDVVEFLLLGGLAAGMIIFAVMGRRRRDPAVLVTRVEAVFAAAPPSQEQVLLSRAAWPVLNTEMITEIATLYGFRFAGFDSIARGVPGLVFSRPVPDEPGDEPDDEETPR